MKNIHIIPTDKPSRLLYFGTSKELTLQVNPATFRVFERSTQNIYITSDEEIKEGDWFYNIISLKPEPFKACENGDGYVNCSKYSHYRIDCKKIILTTDQDLIADGVQAIDDEFLLWFIKNSSCEEVQFYELNGEIFAEPTINYCWPEEPKPECTCGVCDYCEEQETTQILKEAKENALTQETLEEAAERILANNIDGLKELINDDDLFFFYKSVVKCYGESMAEWQAERMYSEEELKSAFKVGFNIGYGSPVSELDLKQQHCDRWFEKFKKK
jgi:hypothetical protein